MTDSPANPSTPAKIRPANLLAKPIRPTAFNWMHVVVFLVCYIPLNPIVVESFRNPNFGFTLSFELAVGVLSMLAGPFAPWLVSDYAEIETSLIVTACAILATGVAIQFAWRPRRTRYEVIRQFLWAITCWLWLATLLRTFRSALPSWHAWSSLPISL